MRDDEFRYVLSMIRFQESAKTVDNYLATSDLDPRLRAALVALAAMSADAGTVAVDVTDDWRAASDLHDRITEYALAILDGAL